MNTKEIARTLVTITEEQWEAILTTSKHVTTLPFVQELSNFDSECEKKPVAKETENELRFKIANLIKRMGVPPHILGYTYLQDAIMMVYEDEEYIHNVVKQLYPAIAKVHGSTGSRVERAIRHAFEIAYNKGNPELLEDVFNMGDTRPVNSHAIAAVVEYIKMYD